MMNLTRIASVCIVAGLIALSVALGLNQATAFQRGPPGAEEGVEVLTRGPVHEAFAETVTFDPQPGLVAPQAPPNSIEESPPDLRPEGDNVAWIPGYWAWDDERNDYLWVSGIWRALPPGRQWVSGYWGQAGRGVQWTSGYWADAKVSEVDYLPEPPQTVEVGPNIAAPSADHTWLPGCWVWQQNRYAWRPGYWAEVQPNWVWIPAHYVWSPRGYVFVDGYYDHSVARRGVLFAPVYFSSSVYSRRGFSYSPVTVINPAAFTSHLFLRPSYGHYYFGDYYSSNYATRGYSSWFAFNSSRAGYDPFYAHQRWHHRSDREWDRRVQADFTHRRDHEEARPPRTWTAQRERSTRESPGGERSFVMAASLDELAKSKEAAIRFQALAQQERQQIGQRGQEVRRARDERQALEVRTADQAAGSPQGGSKPIKVKLPRTSIASPPVERLGQNAPPPAIASPEPDVKVEPRPRRPRTNSESPAETKGKQRDPHPELPKAEPRPERPKIESRPEPPKIESRPDNPKAEPRPERPKVEPRPERPKIEPRPERPKAEPKGKGESPPKRGGKSKDNPRQ